MKKIIVNLLIFTEAILSSLVLSSCKGKSKHLKYKLVESYLNGEKV